MRFKSFAKLAAMAAFLLVAGCQNGPGEEPETPTPEGGDITRFAATIPTPEATRAVVNGENTPVWKAGDNLLVLSYNGATVTNFKSTLDGATANKSTSYFTPVSGRSLPKGRENYAIYPYFQPKLADVSGGSNGNRKFKLTLGEQTPSFGENIHLPLLVGVWDDASESFTMSNPLLIVRLKLSLPVGETDLTMRRIRVAGNNGETLWGASAVFETSDMSLEINEEGAVKEMYMDCAGNVLDAAGKTLSFCVPAQEYAKGLNVKVYCLEGSYETTINPSGINPSADSILEKEVVVELAESNIIVDVVRATDTTVVVAWTSKKENAKYLSQIYPNDSAKYTEDIAKEYKVAIYADEECKQLVYSAAVLKGESLFQETVCPPRFIFTGLTPDTNYYVKIFNLTDSKQTIDPVMVTTATSIMPGKVFNYTKAGDAVLFENFDGCIYGGDLTARAAGVTRSDRSSLTSFNGVDLKGELNIDYEAVDGTTQAYVAAAAGVEIGLFNTLKGLIDDMGLNDWGWIGGKDGATGGSVCARPGYAKIGTGGNRSFIVTPTLSGIPAGTTAKVTVKFKAAPYGDVGKDINADEKSIVVKVLDGTSISSGYKITYTTEGESKTLTLDGTRSSDWKEYSVTLNGVQSTSRIAIGGGRANATDTNRFLLDDVLVCVESLDKSVVSGTITYSDGAPAANVVVSDGFNCVKTDVMGRYSFIPHKDTWYIFYSIPADCEVPINSYGQPAFFTRYTGQKSCDFKLTRMAAKEEEFALFCLADPQCGSNTHISRFKAECVPDVWSHVKSKSVPCYGVTLGDVVYSEGNRNCNSLMTTMRGAMSKSAIGLPVFQTFGNHDYTYFNESNPSQPDATSSTYNLKMQRAFEDVFGPINYSWNRGDVHIVSMRNMQWSNNTAWNSYLDPRFTDEQCKWLEQDLAHVPTDKMVILCLHCSIFGSTNSNVQKVLNMIKKYPNSRIMSGHHHRNQNEPTKSGVYEHNIAAVCGCWWYSRINNDGSPNGYAVFEVKGNNMKNWYYKGVNEGMNDIGYQMRLYRGNMRCGGQYDYIQLQHGSNVILANVFNADSNWVVKVYEDGTYTGKMSLMSQKQVFPSIGTSEASPCKPSTSSSQDWYAIGYHTGVVGRGHSSVGGTRSNYQTPCYHMYKYTLKNSAAKVIRVEATDTFGNVYSSSTITGDYDYSLVEK